MLHRPVRSTRRPCGGPVTIENIFATLESLCDETMSTKISEASPACHTAPLCRATASGDLNKHTCW